MKKPKFFFIVLAVLISIQTVFTQTENKNLLDPSYEIILHVVVASNKQAEKNNLPPSLANVIGKLKNDFSFKNYDLAATFFERITQTGEIYHNGILNQLNQEEKEKEKFYFSNWSLKGLKAGEDASGKNLINFQMFNFGARVPVVVSTIAKGDGGGEIVNYENIGITINRFNLAENAPTLIGSMATPKNDEFIFLILTVRPV